MVLEGSPVTWKTWQGLDVSAAATSRSPGAVMLLDASFSGPSTPRMDPVTKALLPAAYAVSRRRGTEKERLPLDRIRMVSGASSTPSAMVTGARTVGKSGTATLL